MNRFSIPILSLLACFLAAVVPLRAAPGVRPVAKSELSVVRVNSTNQDYDFFRPWSKKNPRAFHGLGAIVAGNRVLVTAQLVANHSYVELERAESGQKTDATVVCVDYEANLALLQPTSENFLAGLHPLDLTLDAAVGDRVNVLQLESNDALVSTPGPITTIEVGHYQLEGIAMLIYRLSLPLQYREGSFTAPVIKDGKLAGILMRYDPRTQSVDVLPAPVIAHFLKDVDSGSYQGFPRIGMDHAPLRDPQLRHYANLPAGSGGVYVTEVVPNSPAAKAGLKPGDVLLEVAGAAVDQDGNYEEPLYGRIAFTHLITTKAYAGDKLPMKIFRDGSTQTLEVTLAHQPPKDYLSEPYVIDEAPRYYVVDGLIFEELSRQYLKEWGRRLGQAGAATAGVPGPLPDHAGPRRPQTDRDPQPGSAGGEQHRLRRSEVSGGHEHQRDADWQSGRSPGRARQGGGWVRRNRVRGFAETNLPGRGPPGRERPRRAGKL